MMEYTVDEYREAYSKVFSRQLAQYLNVKDNLNMETASSILSESKRAIEEYKCIIGAAHINTGIEATVKELPCIGYELIAANTEDTEVSEDSGRISFSTTLTLTVTAQEESNAYFWNSVKEEPEYTINNTVRFDDNGNMILENTRSEAE
jgi:hypothetical protein